MIDRRRFLLTTVSLLAGIRVAPAADSSPGLDGAQTGVVPPDSIREIRDALAPLIGAAQERYQCPGISLQLVTSERVLWSEGFGFADAEAKLRATPQTVYRVGSLAKPLTATVVMQLAEAGEIDIDQPLAGYLPELAIRSRFDAAGSPITVRSVLCHHSGLPTDLNKGMWSEDAFTRVAAALAEEYVAFPPDLVFAYSNVGYTLLGHMVEKVSGIPFADYLAAKVLGPLGMDRTSLGSRPGVESDVSRGYREGRAMDLLPIRDLPAHGLNTSAADQGRYLRALLGGGRLEDHQLLSLAALEEMFEPQNRDNDLDMGIFNGLGWFLDEGTLPGCGRVLRHGGTTLGFAAEAVMLPEEGLGVVVLANADGSRGIVSRLADEILTRVLADAPGAVSAELFLERLNRPSRHREQAEIAGDYATDLGLISIRPEEARLCACITGESYNLIPYPNGWFGIDRDGAGPAAPALKPLAEMQFHSERIDGRDVVIARRGDKEIVLGEKVPPPALSQAWLDRLGRYEVLNADPGFPVLDLELKLREGHICMSYRMPQLSTATIQVPLRPISDTEAIILGIGRTRGETVRIIGGEGGERIRYSGLFGRKVTARTG